MDTELEKAIFYKVVTDIQPTEAEPITVIEIGGENVFSVPKDGNWEIERIFAEYKSPCESIVVVLKKKGEEKHEGT